jgi:heme/copper-type cytochrome/quinol oxidase subunit 2
MNSISPLQIDLFDLGEMALLIPIIGILLPVFIVLIVFVYESKQKKYKYDALIEISKNVKDPDEIKDLLKSFKRESKI